MFIQNRIQAIFGQLTEITMMQANTTNLNV